MAEDVHMRRTVLVVDDHPGFRASVRELLAGGPFEVVAEADDGPTALEAFGRERPDVVLLDIALPGVDGFAIAETLAAQQTPPAVVLISSRDASDYGPRIAVAPIRGFLQKGALSVNSLEVLLR
jgi:DNA-binding NarL/FixJ family response regulator